MSDSDMVAIPLPDARSAVKCPFGHVHIPPVEVDKASVPMRRDNLVGSPTALRDLAMTFFLVLLIGAFAIAAAVALVRGLVAFFRDAEHIRRTGGASQEAFGIKQNRMMAQRVLFQGIAIVLIVVVGAIAGRT